MPVPNSRLHQMVVPTECASLRLDRFLSQQPFISSRTRAAQLIDLGLVTVNGRPSKAAHKLSPGEKVQVQLPELPPTQLTPLDAPLDILFEDADLVVVNKPAGLVVHPAAGHAQDTLVNILLHHIDHLSMGFGETRPGIVHRLDRDTSGILVVAKNDHAHHQLSDQFRLKTAHRIYWAIVHGQPVPANGTLRSHLARHPQDRKRFASHPSGVGKWAVTHYSVLGTQRALSWIQCRLETGRTHQIRVHLSEAGWPIAGDVSYGSKPRWRQLSTTLQAELTQLRRIALHACELGFVHPRTGESMMFKVGWPQDLLTLAKAVGAIP